MNHVMIDLETLGVTPQAPVVAIGGCRFSPDTGEISPLNLYVKVDVEDALRGRTLSPSTFKWWMQQSDAARQEVVNGTAAMAEALAMLTDFCTPETIVWGNGATFDISILEDLYRQYMMDLPWKFYNVRDVRTVVDLASPIMSVYDFAFDGVKHNALDDAKFQAKYVSAMWQALRGVN